MIGAVLALFPYEQCNYLFKRVNNHIQLKHKFT